jgi:hypothetical protein
MGREVRGSSCECELMSRSASEFFSIARREVFWIRTRDARDDSRRNVGGGVMQFEMFAMYTANTNLVDDGRVGRLENKDQEFSR